MNPGDLFRLGAQMMGQLPENGPYRSGPYDRRYRDTREGSYPRHPPLWAASELKALPHVGRREAVFRPRELKWIGGPISSA